MASGFLDLPPELRKRIYDYILIQRQIFIYPQEKKALAGGVPSIAAWMDMNFCPHVSPGVLRTCKMIYREAQHILYSKNLLSFVDVDTNVADSTCVLQRHMAANNFLMIQDLHVHFQYRVLEKLERLSEYLHHTAMHLKSLTFSEIYPWDLTEDCRGHRVLASFLEHKIVDRIQLRHRDSAEIRNARERILQKLNQNQHIRFVGADRSMWDKDFQDGPESYVYYSLYLRDQDIDMTSQQVNIDSTEREQGRATDQILLRASQVSLASR